MRLLITGDTAGGVFTMVTELAEGLNAEGWHVTVATFGPQPAQLPKNIRWFHHTSKLEWQPDPWAELESAGEWLRQLVSREKPELLHFNTLCHGDMGWRVPLVTTIHSCVPSWWSQTKQSPLPPEWNRYRQVVCKSLKAASLLITPTQALLNSLEHAWPLNFRNSLVIPNGVNPSHFQVAPKEPFILSAGRFWDEAKNLQALDSIAPFLEWPVYLAGEVNAKSNCCLLGQLKPDELAGWYARASIFVSTAKYEPFGLAVLEAAMSGCALLLGDIPSLRENWSGSALLFQPGQLVTALNYVVRNADLRADLQRQAWQRSRQLSQSMMVSRYMNAYEHSRSCACVS
jgi:glycosyltransferase involved in cell wall biosynthesis